MVAVTAITFILLFAMYSESTIPAVAVSVEQFFSAVLPSLFPFYVAASILRRTDFCDILSRFAKKIMRPLFGISGAGAFAVITGMICGYPAGAGMSAELYRDKKITKEDVVRLSAFVNNTGPLFLIGTVGVGMLGSARKGVVLWVCHIIASFASGIIVCALRNAYMNKKSNAFTNTIEGFESGESTAVGEPGLGKIISEAMTSSMFTMIPVAAAIIFFAAFNAVCEASGMYGFIASLIDGALPHEITEGVLKGFFEITGGLTDISSSGLRDDALLPLISAITGFAGVSVHFQVAGIYSEIKVSNFTFFAGKCIHSLLAALVTLLFCKIFI